MFELQMCKSIYNSHKEIISYERVEFKLEEIRGHNDQATSHKFDRLLVLTLQ